MALLESANPKLESTVDPSTVMVELGGTSVLPTCIGGAQGGARNWVLPGLIMSPAAAAKATRLLPYWERDLTASSIFLLEATGLTSSAYMLVFVSLLSQKAGIAAVTRMKMRGPSTDPCLTPKAMRTGLESSPFHLTRCSFPDRYDQMRANAAFPIHPPRTSTTTSTSMVSKAEEKSKEAPIVDFLPSFDRWAVVESDASAVSVSAEAMLLSRDEASLLCIVC